jgi:hypothetical protein
VYGLDTSTKLLGQFCLPTNDINGLCECVHGAILHMVLIVCKRCVYQHLV